MYCENPNIILRRDLNKYIIKDPFCKLVYCDGYRKDSFDWRKGWPTPKKWNVTYDNYKNWTLVMSDGELVSIFQPVNCGKCVLCREKRAREWTTRATCETATSTYPPVFVTLSYEDRYVPMNGVEKTEVQKFLKRFREQWFRRFGARLDLRYFAVGEYGRKSGRPHYHLLLWNIPNDGQSTDPRSLIQIQKIKEMIQRAWSWQVDYITYRRLPDYMKFKLDGKLRGNDVTSFYTKIGNVDVSADRGSSAGYCMKYMRKESTNLKNYPNEVFYLASRGNGGIGTRFLQKQMSTLRKDVAVTTIIVPTGLGKVGEFSLPRCFKERLFPSFSRMIPSWICQQLERFKALSDYIKFKTKNYTFLPTEIRYKKTCAAVASIRQRFGKYYDKLCADMRIYKKESLVHLPKFDLDKCEQWLTRIYKELIAYQPKYDLNRFYELSELRFNKLQSRNYLEIDVKAIKYDLLHRQKLHALTETF